MQKPDDMPEDVWQLAREIFIDFAALNESQVERARSGEFDGYPLLIIAARAILAERERCLAIMNMKMPVVLGPNDWTNYVVGPSLRSCYVQKFEAAACRALPHGGSARRNNSVLARLNPSGKLRLSPLETPSSQHGQTQP